MKKFSIFTFLTLSAFTLFAQHDFRDGFVITNEGDTLQGLIDYRGNNLNARKCLFKTHEDENIQEFRPFEIRGYRYLGGKFYVSKLVEENDKEKELFLEFLLDGIVDLFFYYDNGEHYFIADKDGDLIALQNSSEDRSHLYKNVTKENKEYVANLKILFQDQFAVARKVDQVELNHKSLINITKEYHDASCGNEQICIIYEKSEVRSKKSAGVIISVNSINFNPGQGFDGGGKLDIEGFDNHVFGTLGFYQEQNIPNLNERISILTILSYSRVSLENKFSEPIGYSLVTIQEDESLTLNTLSIDLNLKYTAPKGAYRPFISCGYFLDYYFKTIYSYHYQSIANDGNKVLFESKEDQSPFSKMDHGLVFKSGLQTEKFLNRQSALFVSYKYGLGFLNNLTTNYLGFGMMLSF